MVTIPADLETVHQFWFGDLDAHGVADEEHSRRWWQKDPAFDQLIRDRFAVLYDEIAAGLHDAALEDARGRLSIIIVLDQFSRNMFRGTPRMFALDARARELVTSGIALGQDRLLGVDERSFFYMPLMHSEELESQAECCRLFRRLQDECHSNVKPRVAYSLDFAEQHRKIIERFGRFPHRNQNLGRASTPEEAEFLKQPGSSF